MNETLVALNIFVTIDLSLYQKKIFIDSCFMKNLEFLIYSVNFLLL